MNKRIKAIVATTLVAAGIAGAGIAYAAFARTGTAGAQGSSEEFNALTVAGTWVGNSHGTSLLPGEAGLVRLTIGAPADNTVNAEVVSVVPNPITAGDIDGDVTGADKATCAGWLSAQTFTPAAGTVVLAKNATGVKLNLADAVTFSNDATEVCEGMTFKTTWKVAFRASRTAATVGTDGAVTLPLS